MKRFLMYLMTYVLITFSTAFGVVLISNPTKATNTTVNVGGNAQQTEASSPLTYIVDNFTTMKGMNLNATVDVTVDGKPVKILADVTLDLSKGFTSANAGGTLTVFVNGKPVDIYFSYIDGTLYFEILNGSYKITTNNLMASINQILEVANVEMPDLSGMGLDLNNLDITSILSMFDDIKETKTDTYTTLSLYLPYVANVDIKCDLNYNIQEISLPKTTYENYTFKLNVKVSYPEICTITEPENNPIDLTHVFNLAQGLANFVTTNNQIGLNVGVLYNNINLNGDLSFDLNSKNVGFKTTFDNKNLNVYLINNVVYVEFENILVKADITRINEITTLLNNELEIELPIKEIAATLIATTQLELTTSTINLESFDLNNINLGILENFTYENGIYTATIKDIGVVTFEFEDGKFKNIEFAGFDAVAKVKSVEPFEIKPNFEPDSYVDVYDAVPVLNALINTLKLEHHSGVISFEVNNQTINVNYELALNNGLIINLDTNVLDIPVSATIANGKVYISVSDVNIVCNLNETQKLLPLISNYVNTAKTTIDLEQVKNSIDKVLTGSELLFSIFEESENGLSLEILGKYNLNLTYNELIENIEAVYENVRFNISVNSNNETINLNLNENKFVELNQLVALTENLYSYIARENYYFSTTIKVKDYSLNGFVLIENALSNPNLQAEFSTKVLDKQISLKLVNNVVYLEIDGFNIKFNLEDSEQVINFIKTNFGIDTALVIEEATAALNLTELPTTLSGLNLKLTNNTFEINYDQANVTLDVTNNKLNSISLSYNDICLTLDIAKKHTITLNETYIDFVTLLPFIESAINTVEAGKIQGTLTMVANTEAIQVEFKVEYAPNTQVWLQTNYKGANIKVNLYENQILMSVNEIYLKAGLNELNKISEFLSTTFNINVSEQEIANMVNTINVTTALNNFSLSNFNSLVATNNALQVNAFNTNVYVGFNDYIKNITIKTNNIYAHIELTKFAEQVYMPVINTGAYDQIDYVISVVENVYNALQSKNYNVNGTITLNNVATPINLQVLANDTLKVKFATTLYNKDLEAVLIDNTIYATVDGFKIKYNLENVSELINLIEDTFNLNLTELTKEFANSNNININETIRNLYIKTLRKTKINNGYNFTVSVLIDGKQTDLVVTLNNNDELENLTFNYDKLNANLNMGFNQVEKIEVDTTEYLTDLHALTTLIEPINNLVEAKKFEANATFKFDILGDQQTLTLTSLKVDYSDPSNLKAVATAEFLGFDITLAYINNTIYVGVDNLKTYIKVDEIQDLIDWINSTFEQNISLPESSNFSIDDIIDAVKQITFGEIINSITRTPNGIMVNLPVYYNKNNVAVAQEVVISYLDNNFTNIIINHKQVYAEINFVKFGTNVSEVNLTDTEKAAFVHYSEFTELAETVEEFVTGKQYAANARALVYNGQNLRYDVNLGLKIDVLDGLKLDGYAQVAGEQNVEFDLDYWNEYLFISYNGLKLKICEADVKSLISVVLNLFGVDPSLIPFLEDAANDLSNVNFDSVSNLIPEVDFNNPLSLLTLVSDLSYNNGSLNLTIDGSQLSENPNAKEMHFNIDTVNGKLTNISLTNLYTGVTKNEYFNLNIGINDFSEIEGISQTEQATYHDLSGSVELIKAVINTAELNYYHVTATVNVVGTIFSGINIDWDIPLDVQIELNENRKPSIMVSLGEIPTMAVVNKGLFESVKNRMFYIFYRDNYFYLYRTEVNGGDNVEYKLKLHMDDVLADPIYVLQFGTGFTDTIMDAIKESIENSKNHTPNLGNVLTKYIVTNNTNFNIVLNMKEITNDTKMGDMTIDLRVVNNETTNNKNYVGNATFKMEMPLASGVFDLELSSNNIALINIGEPVDLSPGYYYMNNYPYSEGEEYIITNGSAQLASTKQYTITFEENGGTAVSDITAVKDAAITLPTYTDLRCVIDESAGTRTYYRFDGWYTDPDFTSTNKFTRTTMPRGGAVLYAYWVVDRVDKVVTITFNSNGGSAIDNVSEIAGVWIDISYKVPTKENTYVDKGYNWFNSHAGKWTYEVTSYTFAGWYTDSSLTNKFNGYVPYSNTTLYAKWTSSVTTEYYYDWERP